MMFTHNDVWITADRIHNGHSFFPRQTYIHLDTSGRILHISHQKPDAEVIELEGWICPGFINVHCHLELSHLKGIIPKHTGLPKFLSSVVQNRGVNIDDDTIKIKIRHTLREAREEGIVAFGDIANTALTAEAKKDSDIYFHTFFEALGKNPAFAQAAFQRIQTIAQSFEEIAPNQAFSIVPHAPYSISEELFLQISQQSTDATIISIHNQECEAENELFEQGSHIFLDFYNKMGIPPECATPKGKSPLQWTVELCREDHTLILVHNTFTRAADIPHLKKRTGKSFFCLCPNANLYIENRLPDIPMLYQSGIPLCIGTDSLSSNEAISMISEMHTITQHFPQIEKEEIIRWACSHGASALHINHKLGSLKEGLQPGIVLLNPDFTSARRIA